MHVYSKSSGEAYCEQSKRKIFPWPYHSNIACYGPAVDNMFLLQLLVYRARPLSRFAITGSNRRERRKRSGYARLTQNWVETSVPLPTTSVQPFQDRVVPHQSQCQYLVTQNTSTSHRHTHYFFFLGSSSSCVEQRSALPLKMATIPLPCQCSTHHLHLEWYLYTYTYIYFRLSLRLIPVMAKRERGLAR